MAGQGLRVGMKIVGGAAAQRKLMLAKKEAEKTKPLMDKAIIILEMSHMKTFRMQGRPRWKQSQRVSEGGGKTLQSTHGTSPGLLMKTVTARTSKSIREHRGKTLKFGTKLIYGPTHQYGYPKRNIPERRFLGVYNEDIKKMEEVFGKDLSGRFRVVASG